MTVDGIQLAHVGDAIDRLSHGGVNHNEITAGVAHDLLSKYPTVQSAVQSYMDRKIGESEFDAVVNTAIRLESE